MAESVVENLDKTLRHEIRDHLNDIYIQGEFLEKICEGNPDALIAIRGQFKSVENIQKLLDLTVGKPQSITQEH